MFVKEQLAQLVERQEWIRARGWRLVLVHRSPEGRVPEFLREVPLEGVDCVSDPDGDLYEAFELGSGSWRQLAGPAVWWRGLRALIRGHWPGTPGTDVRQMQGAFLVADAEVVSAFRARHAAEQPNLDAMAEDFRTRDGER